MWLFYSDAVAPCRLLGRGHKERNRFPKAWNAENALAVPLTNHEAANHKNTGGHTLEKEENGK